MDRMACLIFWLKPVYCQGEQSFRCHSVTMTTPESVNLFLQGLHHFLTFFFMFTICLKHLQQRQLRGRRHCLSILQPRKDQFVIFYIGEYGKRATGCISPLLRICLNLYSISKLRRSLVRIQNWSINRTFASW